MAVSIPRDESPRTRRRIRAVRVASATLVAFAIAGLIVAGPLQQPVDAATTGASQLTVKWSGDNSTASAFQPTRVTSSPHFAEFKNISISVAQTTGIIDQAVRVSVTGFAGTLGSTNFATNEKNFLQAMQCWGPDPLAANFNETCQWGGRYTTNNGLGNSVYSDNTLRVGPLDVDLARPTDHDVPFRTADGQSISGKPVLVNKVAKYPILDFFGPSTTNEVTSARVGTDGTGYFNFETQTADQAPQLGCGTAAHLRCWLVVVPRGTVFGGNGESCSGIRDPANDYNLYPYGRRNSVQAGSPINLNCDYWKNRVVVPLDFSPVGSKCAVGSSEVRVIGSQLMVGAMSSWQPALCQTVKSTFSFATNPDSIARAQLIESGTSTANIAYTGFPVSPGGLLTDFEREVLAKTKLSYAPVAVSGVVIGFNAEFYGGRQQQLVVSPRLMAKFLTQSYKFTVPSNTSDPAKNFAHLGAVNRKYTYLNQDPEFQALNPTNFNQFTANPGIVLPGPSGADSIRQVWRWILADKDAVAFLNGTPDPSGMTVNPYYLPKGDPRAVVPWWLDDAKKYLETSVERPVGLSNIDGSPQKLSESTLDVFPKDDESLVPLDNVDHQTGVVRERTRFDSIQFSPFTDNMLSGARQAFRADPNSKTTWDPIKTNAANEAGDWVSSGPQLPGAKFMMTITDSPSAARYGLDTASLVVPNSTSAIKADATGMSNALTALRATSLDSVKQIDPAQVAANGYPLTIVTYAGINLTKSTPAARSTISDMLRQVTTAGQVSGSGIGDLPAGYLPLSTELAAQATTSANEVARYSPPPVDSATVASTDVAPTGKGAYAQDPYVASSAPGRAGAATPASAAAADPSIRAGVDKQITLRTAAAVSASGPVARTGLAIFLGVGLAGFLISPILFRGRGFL